MANYKENTGDSIKGDTLGTVLKNKFLATAITLAISAYILIEARNQGDFYIYLSASKDLFQGKDIYSLPYVDWFYYYYSVLFAIVIYPLSFLPAYIGNILWLVFNAFCLFRIIRIIPTYFNLSLFTIKQKWLLFMLSFVFSLRFVLGNFHYQQITIVILYLILEGLQLIFSGNKLWGALLIALGINIKILPIVILPYLFYRKEFAASFFVIVWYAAMMLLPAFIVGVEHNNVLLASWWTHINPMSNRHILDVDERSFHSLSTLLATLFVENVPDKYALPIKRNIANVSLTQLTYILNITRLLLVSFSFYFFRTKPFTPQPDKMRRYWEISYLLLLVPLIFPHQQHYAFLFIVPAMYYIFYYLITEHYSISPMKFRILALCSVLSYLASNLSFLFGEFNAYYEHFKILTYGALLIIPMLAVCIPKRIAANY